MSLKDMILKIFKVKKYKIIKFGSIDDKEEELYFVKYRKSIFSGYKYLLKNDIIDITETVLMEDNFNVSDYICKEKWISNNLPFLYYDAKDIEKYNRKEISNYYYASCYKFTDIEKCEEKIENHKKIVKFIKRKEKEDRIKKKQENKKTRPKTVKRY